MLQTENELIKILETFKICVLVRGCLRCGEEIILYNENMVRCLNKICKYRYSIFKNTCFYSCKISPITFLKIVDLYLNYVPYKLISTISTISKNRVADIIYKFNHDSIFYKYLSHLKLGGTGDIVEIDESKFGRRKYNRGHRIDGVWVFGCVERKTKKILLIPVERRTKEILLTIIRQHIHPYTIIYSDCWKAYTSLKNYYLDHKTVNHSKEFVDKYTGVHTNTIEGNWNGIKRNIPFRNRTKMLVRIYLLRFMLNRNSNSNKLKDLIILSLSHNYNN